jgi:hypothetical protein
LQPTETTDKRPIAKRLMKKFFIGHISFLQFEFQ